jgi:dimethylargininase
VTGDYTGQTGPTFTLAGMKALMREPSDALERCALTYLARRPIDLAKARAQHAAYRSALEALGVKVRILGAEPDLPDAVFVEDTALVVDECAVITRPGLDSRRGEVDSVAAALEPVRPIVRVTPPGTLEGGDVLRVGRTLLVGQTPRTNAEGTRQLSAYLQPHGYDVVAVTPTGCLHLKSAVTFIGDETVLVNPDWIDLGVLRRWQCVPVAPEEPFGANALLVGETVFTAASAPLTRCKLDALGFHTEVLDTSEFEKAEAALTCLSLLFA